VPRGVEKKASEGGNSRRIKRRRLLSILGLIAPLHPWASTSEWSVNLPESSLTLIARSAILFEFIGVPCFIRPFLGARRFRGIIPRVGNSGNSPLPCSRGSFSFCLISFIGFNSRFPNV
jgi:hypothetical protein